MKIEKKNLNEALKVLGKVVSHTSPCRCIIYTSPMFRELKAYMAKNGNDCCRSEVKNGGRLGTRTPDIHGVNVTL